MARPLSSSATQSVVTAAELLAEISDHRDRHPTNSLAEAAKLPGAPRPRQ
jgi:hypothetical protein